MPPKDLDAGETDYYQSSTFKKYSINFYYGIILLVGGEIAPISIGQTIYAALVIILGSIVTAFIFGNMAALMANINKKDSHF